MKVTYEIENGEKVKVKTYADGRVYKYDTNGNMIYYKLNSDFEQWNEYDANGNEIHSKNTDGYEVWNDYDANGNKIHCKENCGFEYWK